MKIHKPYTYLLHHIPTDTFYYGVRWAKNCHPDEFWVKYFTSSKKLVSLYRTLFGDESFEFEIRKVFDDSKKAVEWEHKVLRRMKVLEQPGKWLNRNNGKAILNEISPTLGIRRLDLMGKNSYLNTVDIQFRRLNSLSTPEIRKLPSDNMIGDLNISKRADVKQKQKESWTEKRKIEWSLKARALLTGVSKTKCSCVICRKIIGGFSNLNQHFDKCRIKNKCQMNF